MRARPEGRRTVVLAGRVQGRALVRLKGKKVFPPTICARRMARRESIFASGHQGRGSHGSYRRTPESKEKCR